MTSASSDAATGRTARRVHELVDAGLVPAAEAADLERVAEEFSIAIPPSLVDLIDPHDPDDPIARQFVPHSAELRVTSLERADPIGDDAHAKLPGIVHRYPDRLLLKPLHVCSVYCRFCFRRTKVGPGSEHLTADQLQTALEYVRCHPQIWEVILSGGDPLVLSPRRLGQITSALSDIAHVDVVRVHTRVPIASPERVTADLVDTLRIAKAVYVVVHCNHPRELTEQTTAACASFVDGGIPVLAQTVLLRGVNDDADTLEALFRGLVRARVKPYYLHHGDLAPGTSHFRTSIEEGQRLMRALRGRVSGLCQPTYVLDIPGGYGKVPIGPQYLRAGADSSVVVEDFEGRAHVYVDDAPEPPTGP